MSHTLERREHAKAMLLDERLSALERCRAKGLHKAKAVHRLITAGDSGTGREVALVECEDGSLCEVTFVPGGGIEVSEGW